MADKTKLLSSFDEVAIDSKPGSETTTQTASSNKAPPLILYLFIGIAALSNVLFGYENSVIAQGKLDFAKDVGLSTTSSQYGFLAGAMPIGATVGVVLAGFMQDSLGRRRTLCVTSLSYIGATAISYFSNSFEELALGRVLTGVVIGITSSTVPMFIAELSPPALRGTLVTLNQVAICTGILIGYGVTKVLSPNWRLEFIMGAPLSALLLLMFLFVTPYSPRWLMTKNREDEARTVLMQLRGGDVDVVEAEIDGMRSAISLVAGSSPWAKMREKHVLWAIAIGMIAATMQQWCGVNAVNAFAQDIFGYAGFSASDSSSEAIYIGVAKLLFVIVALILMDRVGRKPLLLVGCAGMMVTLIGLSLALSAASSAKGSDGKGAVPPLVGYGATVSLILYMAFFEISLGPVLWLLLSELYPLQVKGKAMTAGSFTCWLFTYVVTQAFPPMVSSLGAVGVFYLFSAVCFVSGIWIYYYLPETKGKTLEEIEGELLKSAGRWSSDDEGDTRKIID